MNLLKSYFKADVAYEDTKKHKPFPEPLILAAKKLKVKPEETVYIGDSESDMKAAKAAGMKFVFYSRKRLKGADVQVKSFNEIPDVVAKL